MTFRDGKTSFTPQVDLKKMTVKIPVMEYKLGDGKVLYSNNCDPDVVRKFCSQFVLRNEGIRSMEMRMLERDTYNRMREDQIAVLLVGG